MTLLILAVSWLAGISLAYALVAINPSDDDQWL